MCIANPTLEVLAEHNSRACDIGCDLQMVEHIVYEVIELDTILSFEVPIPTVRPAEKTRSGVIATIILCNAEPNFPERNASCVVPAVRLKINSWNVETRIMECF